MIVREATLDDTKDIVAVHSTNPDRPFGRPIESLSIAERYDHGGPWMSVESCAIHLNNLLAWGYAPLVVEDEDTVIAEAEYYIGRDIPPLGTTLDISAIYVQRDFQRRGAGSLLMEEMILRAAEDNCDNMTVSGSVESPGFYGRFGFSPVFDMETVVCPVPTPADSCDCEPYLPVDFEQLPEETLWIGRIRSPCQKWREIVDGIKKRDAILPEHAEWPDVTGLGSRSDLSLGFLIPGWRDPTKADAYCWSAKLTGQMVAQLLALANDVGYGRVRFLCHPDVTGIVGEVSGCGPSGSWPIWGKKL